MQATRHPQPANRLLPISARLPTLATFCLLLLALRGSVEAADTVYAPQASGVRRTFSLASPVGDLVYTLGRGLHVGDTTLTLGGYANINLVRDEGGPAQLNSDDLSFFVIADPLPYVHLFSELELEDLIAVDDHGHGGTVDNDFVVERLYGDLAMSDQLSIRIGQFLTPVGRWNVIHAQPLVWTTSRPLATILPFDPHTTGAMLFGSAFPRTGRVTYSVYGQFANQLEPSHEPVQAERSAGARFEYAPVESAALGASYLAFREAGDWRHLGGIDTLWRHGPIELMGELVFGGGSGEVGNDWGLYLQNVVQISPRLYLVGRYEHFDPRPSRRVAAPVQQPEVNLVVLGLAFKPAPYVVLKAEYLVADHREPESPPGFKSSFAILF